MKEEEVFKKRQNKIDQGEVNELKEFLASKSEPQMNKNLITNAEFNKDMKKKFDMYRHRMIMEAEAKVEAEA